MRGSPLLRLVLVLAGLLLLAFPLRHLTSRPPTPVTGPAPAQEKQMVATRIALESTSTPFRFQITHLGRILWQGESDAAGIEREVRLRYPSEGIDLLVEAQWNVGTPAALRIQVTPAGRSSSRAILWGSGTASEVFTFR